MGKCDGNEEEDKDTEEKNIVVTSERHKHARTLVDSSRLDIVQATSLPKQNLTITHPAEPGRCYPIVFTQPNNPRALYVKRISKDRENDENYVL